MSPTKYPTLVAPIDVTMCIQGRVGRAAVKGIFDFDLKLVPNIASGLPHRVLIKLSNSFEFNEAEIASCRNITRRCGDF